MLTYLDRVYTLAESIDQGTWSKIYRYVNGDKILAVKRIERDNVRLIELDILARLSPHCPYLIQVKDIRVEDTSVSILMSEGYSFNKFFFGLSGSGKGIPLFNGDFRQRIIFIIQLIKAVYFILMASYTSI